MQVRNAVIAALLAVGSLTVAACGSSTPAPSSAAPASSSAGSSATPAGGDIAITYSAPVAGALPFLPVEVAMKNGYFKEQGVTVTVKQTAPAALPAALTSNQINMTADVVYNSARYVEKGVGVKYVAGLNDNVDFQLLAAKGVALPKPPGAEGWKTTFAALKGKKIGVNAKAGPLGLTLIALLKIAGVNAGDYTLIDTPGTVALNALTAKQVDAVVSGGGFDKAIVEAGAADPVLAFAKDIPDVFGSQVNAALVVTDATLKQFPDLAKKLQTAIFKADAYMKDPANNATLTMIATATGTAKTAGLSTQLATYAYSGNLSLKGIQAALDWAQLAGITKNKIDAKSLIADGATSS